MRKRLEMVGDKGNREGTHPGGPLCNEGIALSCKLVHMGPAGGSIGAARGAVLGAGHQLTILSVREVDRDVGSCPRLRRQPLRPPLSRRPFGWRERLLWAWASVTLLLVASPTPLRPALLSKK